MQEVRAQHNPEPKADKGEYAGKEDLFNCVGHLKFQ